MLLLSKCLLLMFAVTNLASGMPSSRSPSVGDGIGNSQRRKSCQLIFNIDRTPDGEPQVSSISLPPLKELMSGGAAGAEDGKRKQENVCNLVFALQPTYVISGGDGVSTSTQKPQMIPGVVVPVVVHEPPSAGGVGAHEDDKDNNASQPSFEEQLVVWPPGVEHDDVPPIAEMPQMPLYEDQLIIFPTVDFEEDNLPSAEEQEDADDGDLDVWEPDQDSGESSTQKPPITISADEVKIMESYHTVHPNGTTEYKLVLSNGLVNYKKIYNKFVGDKLITVQEGYDSIPVPGHNNEYQTQYYIADENGHNVYKVEHNFHRPQLPAYLDYRHEMMMNQGVRPVRNDNADSNKNSTI